MKNDFFKGFNTTRIQSPKTFLTNARTVCILHKDGRITEHINISDPWRYITKVKKSMDVKNAWIKEEN